MKNMLILLVALAGAFSSYGKDGVPMKQWGSPKHPVRTSFVCDAYIYNHCSFRADVNIVGAYSTFSITPVAPGGGHGGTVDYDDSYGLDVDVTLYGQIPDVGVTVEVHYDSNVDYYIIYDNATHYYLIPPGNYGGVGVILIDN